VRPDNSHFAAFSHKINFINQKKAKKATPYIVQTRIMVVISTAYHSGRLNNTRKKEYK
jgi:hypothetical protein